MGLLDKYEDEITKKKKIVYLVYKEILPHFNEIERIFIILNNGLLF